MRVPPEISIFDITQVTNEKKITKSHFSQNNNPTKNPTLIYPA